MSAAPPLIRDVKNRVEVRGYLECRLQQLAFIQGGVKKPDDLLRLRAEQDCLIQTMRDLCGFPEKTASANQAT